MNRRNFLRNLAGIGLFTILPGAGRIWKVQRVVPEYVIDLPPGTPPLDMEELFRLIYRIKREREASYRTEPPSFYATPLDELSRDPLVKMYFEDYRRVLSLSAGEIAVEADIWRMKSQ